MLNVNKYFNGNVASISLQTDTLPATVGVMDIGEYEFNTSQHEVMTVISGHLRVKLTGSDQWREFSNGHSFEVAAQSLFQVKADIQTAYFCTYSEK